MIRKKTNSAPSRKRTSKKKNGARELNPTRIRRVARNVLNQEAAALSSAAKACIDPTFVEVVRTISQCRGRLVVSGMGKAGFIAQKVSATFASTGTPSLFLHPADALHGDLGRITGADVVLLFSHSGETEEVARLIGPVKRVGAVVIAITAEPSSTLGSESDLAIAMGRFEEAGHGLAPTTSTTVMLGIGDALAMSVLELRGFTEDEFYFYHPAGALGRKLMRVHEVMRKGPHVPIVQRGATLGETVAVMTKTPGRPGAAIVVNKRGELTGMFTDGDLRRMLENGGIELDRAITNVMSTSPKTVGPDHLVVDAAQLLREYRVDQVPVVDPKKKPVGLLDVQDLLALRFL